MEERTISYEKSEGVGTITLNRDAKLNALNFQMLEELWELFQDIISDEDVRVIVVTGAGRYFSAGADLEIVTALRQENFRWQQRKYWNRVFGEFEDIQKLSVAALNGPAIGGGLELALCCDLRYAADSASFRMPQIDFGILPDAGATTRLPGLIGLARAKEFILSGQSIDAKKAEELGLVNQVFPSDTFDAEVRTLAVGFAEKAPLALGMGKQLINRSYQQRDVRFGLEDAMNVQTALIGSKDYEEAMTAFKEKRRPVFRGR